MNQINQYPLWKYIAISAVIFVCALYALPNLYGEDPAVQISPSYANEINVTEDLKKIVQQRLDDNKISYISFELTPKQLLVRFEDTDTQLKAYSLLKGSLTGYIVAQNLASSTPNWLLSIGAKPMYLGLDLRGGVHFLMQIDMETAIRQDEERYIDELRSMLIEQKIRYKAIKRLAKVDETPTVQNQGKSSDSTPITQTSGVELLFGDAQAREKASKLVAKTYPEFLITPKDGVDTFGIQLTLTEQALKQHSKQAIEQNVTALRNRVNELGVAEPVIQQQGEDRIVVQLPGIQDTARAKEILGSTATLEFRLVAEDEKEYGARQYKRRDTGNAVTLKRKVIVTGDNIVDAATTIDSRTGSPATSVTLDAQGAKRMYDMTTENVLKPMAVVFIEHQVKTQIVNGQEVKERKKVEEVISVATIQEPFGKNFQVTGLSMNEARNLALLLRAGALKVPMEIVEERTIGPSLGKENIRQGMLSVLLGFLAVLVFMWARYSTFGMVANFALFMNVVILAALLSLLQATLTLPGIAGIVLTLGMAVDANVLIFERIREEIFNNSSPQASIHAGFEKAFSTIADSNLTTLIAALALFAFGTGPVKGFAITLSLGITTSMFTAITVSRAVINYFYGGRKLDRIPV